MSNHVEYHCPYEYVNATCPFGKPVCTTLCDYKPYIGKFLRMGIEFHFVVRFFRMYRKWMMIYWKKYVFGIK